MPKLILTNLHKRNNNSSYILEESSWGENTVEVLDNEIDNSNANQDDSAIRKEKKSSTNSGAELIIEKLLENVLDDIF